MSETYSSRWDEYCKEQKARKAVEEGLRAPGTFESTCDEILDALNTRKEYLEMTRKQALTVGLRKTTTSLDSRLDELKVIRAIINTIKGEDE